MTKRWIRKFYFKSLRTLSNRKKKKLIRKKIPSKILLNRGQEVLKNRSLLYNGVSFLVRHSIKKGYKLKQYKDVFYVLAVLKLVLKMSLELAFMYLFRRITPLIKFLPKTFGRTVFKIPVKSNVPVNLDRAVHKLVLFSRLRHEDSFALKLAGEFLQSLRLESRTIKWKQSIHTEAFANRANLTYLRYY